MVEWTKYALSTGTAAGYVILTLVVLVVFAFLAWWIFRLIKYNKKVIIRKLTGGGNILIESIWAKEFKDRKSGAIYWRLKKKKTIIPRPPPKAIAIAKGGREWVDLYDTGQGQYVPAETSDPIFLEQESFVKSFQPITESQRASYVDQIEKSYAYRTKGLTDIIREAVPYIALVMILAVFLLFLSEGMKPIIEQAQIASAGSKDFKIAAEVMREAVETLRGTQVIGGRPPPGNFTPPN